MSGKRAEIDVSSVPLNMRMGFNDARMTKKRAGAGFKIVHGVPVEKPATVHRVSRGEEEFSTMMRSRKLGETFKSAELTRAATKLPPHVRDTRKVLRFNAYFLEPVHESAEENHRTRSITILFYVEDGTLQLSEPKEENSGLMQGTFVRRHKCPKPGGAGGFVGLTDLVVGADIKLYGRTMRIIGCDGFTREFCHERGIEQPEDIPAPFDAYSTTRAALKARDTGADSEIFRGKKMNPLKKFMEASLGRAGGGRDTLSKFLENDGKVLRFYGLWDDRDSVYGDRLLFRIHYFLADDTMEILEVYQPNSGRDKFPALLKRQPLPKKVLFSDDRARGCEEDVGSEDYYNEDDLAVGKYLNVLGRNILLYDADAYTKEWYKAVKGLDFSDSVVDVEEKAPPPVEVPPPPPTGFGSEEDSLGSFKYLVPKPPKKDWVKLMENEGKVLRFVAKLANPRPIDVKRRFIIGFSLADDTLSVFEPPVRNSGIVGGKWLASGKYKNPDTGEYVVAGDLYVGGTVTLKGQQLVIESADEYSLKVMEGTAHVWPLSQIDFVLNNLKLKMREHSVTARRMFRTIDKDFSGFITLDEFNQALRKWGMTVPKQALVTLMRHYDTSGDGRISYSEFCDAFLEKEDEGGVSVVARVKGKTFSDAELKSYLAKSVEVELSDPERLHLEDLLSRFSFVFQSRNGEQAIREEFRKFDTNKDHTVDREEFRAAMGGGIGQGHFNLNEHDISVMEKVFFHDGLEKLDYEAFMSVLRHHAERTTH
mmetsp:Transcript_22425/g.78593  ORF Transcript_22425/g.78593 Transcript_22425/m.78593 type:complete len:763 (-) Transcript_22425:246-2534(-)